jgi:hypothetical protein
MSAPTSKYTCEQLGVCQCATPSCATCPPAEQTHPVPFKPAIATLAVDDESPTSWDYIGSILAEAAVIVATVAVAFGAAGYLWGQL